MRREQKTCEQMNKELRDMQQRGCKRKENEERKKKQEETTRSGEEEQKRNKPAWKSCIFSWQ